ncbi:3-oxoacyl-ACP reductase, partial [Stenotrophomonas maltophilia]|nr:3-oxoacyl-ACP reductase [Stenotrophomonas maltophilia]
MNTAGSAAEHGSALQAGKPVIDFTGRRVLIAGGSKGIGREMALAFAGAGAQVSVCA